MIAPIYSPELGFEVHPLDLRSDDTPIEPDIPKFHVGQSVYNIFLGLTSVCVTETTISGIKVCQYGVSYRLGKGWITVTDRDLYPVTDEGRAELIERLRGCAYSAFFEISELEEA